MSGGERAELRLVAEVARDSWADVSPRSPQNIDYARAAHPAAVLALLDALDRAEGLLKEAAPYVEAAFEYQHEEHAARELRARIAAHLGGTNAE